METEGIVFSCILGAALLFLIQHLIASAFYTIAQEKGYDQKKYYWLPFFLGMIGFLLVIALPDHNKSVQQPAAPKSVPAFKQPAAPKNEARGFSRDADLQRVPQKNTQSEKPVEAIVCDDGDICCPICGQIQPAIRRVCWGCGAKFKESQED